MISGYWESLLSRKGDRHGIGEFDFRSRAFPECVKTSWMWIMSACGFDVKISLSSANRAVQSSWELTITLCSFEWKSR